MAVRSGDRFREPLTSDNLRLWFMAAIGSFGLLGIPVVSWVFLDDPGVLWIGIPMAAVGLVSSVAFIVYLARPVRPHDVADDLITWAPKLTDDWKQRPPPPSPAPRPQQSIWREMAYLPLVAAWPASAVLFKTGANDGSWPFRTSALVFLGVLGFLLVFAGGYALFEYLRQRYWS